VDDGRKAVIEFDIERLRSMVDYCPSTGVIRWKPRPASLFSDDQMMTAERRSESWNKKYAGSEAGCVTRLGYRIVTIDYISIRSHRIAWAIHYGEWPSVEIDHINRIRTDNRIDNLRLATSKQNKWNQSIRKDSTTGVKGVSWCSTKNKYRATSKWNGKYKLLGYFSTIDAAASAYARFAETHFKDFANPEKVTTWGH
jgi:hypothetical protein